MDEERIVTAAPIEEDRQLDLALRPKTLDEFVGQEKLKENQSIAIEAAGRREAGTTR